MTKKEAIAKISKLKKINRQNSAHGEADNAEKLIKEISAKFQLSQSDLEQGMRADAFDDLMGELNQFVGKHRNTLPSPVFDVIERIKRDTKEDDKAKALEQIVNGIRVASAFFGFHPTVASIKTTVNTVLEKHSIRI